jgi:Tetratricopeptide repeat
MTGDLAGANKILERYPQGLPAYERAQWEFLTGSRKNALARIQAEAVKAQGERASLLWAQTAVWQLQTGDRAEAGNSARNAGRALGGLVQFLVQGSAQPSGSPIADALSAIFRQDFQAALPLLEQAYTKTLPNADGQIRILLAWANLETGHFDRARDLLRFPPIPLSAGDQMFASLVFPRFFAIRDAVLKQQGKQPEAARDLQLFQRYSGDLPDKFQ